MEWLVEFRYNSDKQEVMDFLSTKNAHEYYHYERMIISNDFIVVIYIISYCYHALIPFKITLDI